MRAWCAQNKTFVIVVVSLLVLFFLTWVSLTAFGTGSGGVEIGPVETTR